MKVFKIKKDGEMGAGSRADMEVLHDLENLRFLSERQARDYTFHLMADDTAAHFLIEENSFIGIHDAAENRVYLRQGPNIVAYYASRLGFVDLREMVLVKPEEIRPEIMEKYEALVKAS